MNNTVIIEKAKESEIDLINSWYKEIGFVESDYSSEFISIAKIGDKYAGVGRLQNIDGESAELGGIYVIPEFRGKKVARKIVAHLLENAASYKKLYCLPFSHLKNFYISMGFSTEKDIANVPKKVLCKHSWCNNTYSSETLLYSLTIK